MTILIEGLSKRDAEDLLEFELKNRIFFEEMVHSRGDEYFTPDVFNNILAALLDEQFQGLSQFYLIKDRTKNGLGRINLVDFDEFRKVCHLGYRIGQVYTKKGIASKALAILLESLTDTTIEVIKAKTTTNNIASQKVLEKNGFEKIVGTSDEQFEINDQKVNFIFYKWTKGNQL
ncbi:GNAT family N-acetyltransferase [Peribacillus psychrosaccharolyticus]|uniref:GNAT family N-acetyltransferase n=1 Tax=Peribacillus psychrosaccharolyticus TaxID=1407 RepID=A0A974NN37_PERPY|nr:GNAT family N-acetyltransferase [Peribacillus psychrosaccharolyticus]MEC2056033.1 GNAT family N-acetyltransferase [Peribacillus psychrosaccharolyticus]MED3745475.1 GNAT family N-acetyltransferase [Peribacillus psychrosaccharolyticus]QQT00766.1 GNAT family N-acetyltransferase [Peribacillus psychrosaccharolyticus]